MSKPKKEITKPFLKARGFIKTEEDKTIFYERDGDENDSYNNYYP